MRAKLNLFKTSPASRVADKRHIPGPCGRSELRQTAEAEVMLPARAEVPTRLHCPSRAHTRFCATVPTKVGTPPDILLARQNVCWFHKAQYSSGAAHWDYGVDWWKFSTDDSEQKQQRFQSGCSLNLGTTRKATQKNPTEAGILTPPWLSVRGCSERTEDRFLVGLWAMASSCHFCPGFFKAALKQSWAAHPAEGGFEEKQQKMSS